MKKGVIIFLMLFSVIFLSNFVVASDVAYVVRNVDRADNGFLEAFEEMDLDVDLIADKDIKITDFSEYGFIFIGDNRIKNAREIPVDEYPSVIANGYYGEEFGLTNKGGISKLASNSPLKIKMQEEIIQVYDKSSFKLGGVNIPYYYLPKKYKKENMMTIATTSRGYDEELGDVISYSTEEVNKCFFGITKTKYWTDEAKDLFEECVMFVQGKEKNHDVLLDDEFEDSIKGIRIEDKDAGEFLTTPILRMCTNYEFRVKLKNVGEYIEDVSIVGTISGPENFEDVWAGSRNNFNPGSSTTVSGKHSEDFCEGFVEGTYTITYEAQINNDENIENNIVKTSFQLVSEGWDPFHDVEIVEDYSNSVNGIRIKDLETGEYILDSVAVLDCTKEYKIDYKTVNAGSFIEDVTLNGVLGGFAWDTTKNGLAPGKTTTAGSKKINEDEFLEIGTGSFSLEISAEIEQDINPENNFRSREVEVVCE